jgi:hypothetical protein
MLTAQLLRELADYDPKSGLFRRKVTKGRWKAGSFMGAQHTNGYISINVAGCKAYAHRLAWLYTYGEWPQGEIDHINRVRYDNRIENLRDVSRAENCHNNGKRGDNTTGRPGVFYNKRTKKWTMLIGRSFDNYEAACAARDVAEEAMASLIREVKAA